MELAKIIKAWECCTDDVGVDNCDKCPYVESRYDGCMLLLKKDTIAAMRKVADFKMNDPYKRFHEDIVKAISKQTNMIVWLAKRTMSVKDYMDFVEEFGEKHDKCETIDSLIDEIDGIGADRC